MQFLVIARDGTDPDAPARRTAVRERHLQGVRPLVESGQLVIGGAILDEAGTMVGSMLVLDVEDEAAAKRIIESDIYTTGGVWQSYELLPFRRAV